MYTTGYFTGTFDFDPEVVVFNLTSARDYDVFISNLDASGNFIWAKQLGETSSDYGYDLTVDNSGNV
ncbi:MAG: SBBP repeat-containing protein [Bacteroidia bacterium]|nr:SBBP repeat-containing protein [Bacteroidia bacterium]MCZ2277609.1 SBBP repeat-containing protein [Bacteroidia bacterium]